MTNFNPRYGQVAYEAYRDYADGHSLVTGADLPPWEEQTTEIQEAWTTAAAAVIGGMFPVRDR